jgi:membrane protein required for beta-lactamase induction
MESDGFGWKVFAGIMILIVGALNVFDGLVGLTQENYIKQFTNGQLPITNNVKTWSWVVLILGIIMILAGFLIFSGNMFGRVVGILVAALNLLVQLAYLNHNTFWSFTMILVDILVIYGLVAHGGLSEDRRAYNDAVNRNAT